MISNSFPEMHLPWYEIITRPPEVSLFATTEPETSADADSGPELSDEVWVTRSVMGCYND
jgi:hypothetical protein